MRVWVWLAQEKVERYYYELRQKLFEFDEVIAVQRQNNYAKRSSVLRSSAEEMRAIFLSMAQALPVASVVVSRLINSMHVY